MSGTIPFVCWIPWLSRCFPAATFFQTESRVSCPRWLRKVLLKHGRQWRNRDQWICCQGTSWVRRKIFRKIRVIRTARGINNWIRVMFHPAAGNWRETSTQTQQCILKRGNKMTLNLPAPGNWGEEMNLQAQPAPGNWSEVRTSNSEGERWNSTKSKSPTIDTSRKSSRTCGKSWISQKRHQLLVSKLWRPTHWSGIINVDNDESRHSSWTKLRWNLEVYRNTNFEELQNLFDIT